MQTEFFERLDELSQESRHQLDKQIKNVQSEARRLKMQARRLRRAQRAEVKKRQNLLKQVTSATRDWSQEALRRSGEIAQNLKEDAGHNLDQQSTQVVQNLTDWSDDATARLRKQGSQLTQSVSEWGDDTGYALRKQGKKLQRNMRRRGQSIANDLADRRNDATRTLRKRSRVVAQDLADRRDDVAKKLRKQSKQLRKQGEKLVSQRNNRFWSILGFCAGLLLAGGVTYLLIRRNFSQNEEVEAEQFDLPTHDTLNGFSEHSDHETQVVSGGRTAVAAKTTTEVEKAIAFVGVLSTRQYYPIAEKPEEATDLVFFETEDDAKAEGFSAAPAQ